MQKLLEFLRSNVGEFDTLNWPQIDILFWPHLGRVNILTVKDFFKTVAKI